MTASTNALTGARSMGRTWVARGLGAAMLGIGVFLAGGHAGSMAQAQSADAAAETSEASEVEIIKTHGYSYFGNLSYPADYPHFNYVNPDAPKGGEISLALSGTF